MPEKFLARIPTLKRFSKEALEATNTTHYPPVHGRIKNM
jgi:hypothetical protein